mgnify:CR=1 FL=1
MATSVLTGSVITKFYAEAQANPTQGSLTSMNSSTLFNASVLNQPATSANYEDSPLPDDVKIGIAATVCLIAGVTQVIKINHRSLTICINVYTMLR